MIRVWGFDFSEAAWSLDIRQLSVLYLEAVVSGLCPFFMDRMTVRFMKRAQFHLPPSLHLSPDKAHISSWVLESNLVPRSPRALVWV